LVARTNRSRLPSSHLPMIASVRPAVSGVGGMGEQSAVSRKSTPASAARARMANEPASSHWVADGIGPRQISETVRPGWAMRRICMTRCPVAGKREPRRRACLEIAGGWARGERECGESRGAQKKGLITASPNHRYRPDHLAVTVGYYARGARG